MIDPREAVARSFERIEADGRSGIWIEVVERERADAAADEVARRLRQGRAQPLAGQTVAVKGNIDVAGLRTTAGCPTYGRVAVTTATAVRRLEDAGAVVVGVTNLDQFATGLVGTRSPYGPCPNAHWPDLVSGGSSSGSAVAVAAGHVDLAVGTDTAGSGRVPAAANGIVGVKPTRGRISAVGVVPACQSLDCVSVFARSVAVGGTAAAIAAAVDTNDPWSRHPPPTPGPRARRIGIPRAQDLVLGGPIDAAMFRNAVGAIASEVGAEITELDLSPFLAAGALLYEGAFVAERYAAVGSFLETAPEGLDPVVSSIILAARDVPAWQLARDHTELARLRQRCQPVWDAVEVLAVPSVPRLPSPSEVDADPIGANTALGRYTTFANLLDLCALTLPIGEPLPSHPPVSISLLAPAWADESLITLGRPFT